MVQKKEKVNFYTHFISAIISFVGTIALLIYSINSAKSLVIALIYGFSITILFSASALYHAKKQQENEKSIWRKMDHTAIFIMIAGTYTPICYLYLDTMWFIIIVTVQWAMVFFGMYFSFFWFKAPRVVYTLIYLIMGWMAIIPIKTIMANMPPSQFAYLWLGGIAFAAGAIFYAIKKPVIKPDFFGFHEIFHFLIMIGASFHYVLVLRGFQFMNMIK